MKGTTKISQGSHFDAIADRYDKTIPRHIQEHYLMKRTRFLRALGRGGRALDIGCGTGLLDGRLQQEGFDIIGLDESLGMLSHHPRRARTLASSSFHLPFRENTFDLVFSIAVFHHLAHPDPVRRTIAEMVRVVKRGCPVVIWDHNPLNPYWPLFMKRLPQDTGEERLIPLREIVEDFHACGVQQVKATRKGFVPDFIPSLLLSLFQVLEWAVERTPLLQKIAAHNVVVGTKEALG